MESAASGEHTVLAHDLDPALPYRRLVVHVVKSGAFFVNFEDRPTARAFGLDPDALFDRIASWQHAMKKVVDQLRAIPPNTIAPVVGVAHQSKIRGSNGWNFGFITPLHRNVLTRGAAVPLDLEDLAIRAGLAS